MFNKLLKSNRIFMTQQHDGSHIGVLFCYFQQIPKIKIDRNKNRE